MFLGLSVVLGAIWAHQPAQRQTMDRSQEFRLEKLYMMREDGIHKMPEGYHKRAYVYIGSMAVLTTFDSGSFRNAVSSKFLGDLEKMQAKGELGDKMLVSKRMPIEGGDRQVGGATEGMTTSYSEVVTLTVTFKGDQNHSATVAIVFCIMPGLAADLLLGCPTPRQAGIQQHPRLDRFRGL